MECNKEEALRAKGIAEKRMQNKDFAGARKIALKAQQLYPDLENISQMLMVCDVHCSAENKMYGNEMDWYGILKIEQTADEATIRKQYRKFALILHPDKNNFAGAEAAFKLIGEAQRVLLDHGKRSLHDMKRRASLRPTALNRPSAPNRPSAQANKNLNVGKQPGVQTNFMYSATSQFTGLNPQHQQPQQQPQPGFSNGRQTFWTVCPFCAVRYQYYKEIVNRALRCQSCMKPFIAYDMNAQGAPPGTNRSQPAFSQQKEASNQGAGTVGPQSTFENPTSNVGFQGNVQGEKSTMKSFRKTGCTSEVGGGSKANEKCGNVDMGVDKEGGFGVFKPSGKVNGKRGRKQVMESSESCDTGSSTDNEEDVVIEQDGDLPAGQNYGSYGERYPRRSNRSKQHVSYSENLSDDDDLVSRPKKSKGSGSSCATEEESEDALLKKEASKMNKPAGFSADPEDEREVKQTENASFGGSLLNGNKETKTTNGKETATEDDYKKSSKANADSTSNSSSKSEPDPEFYEYPDPDFSDFDKDRKEECFAVGQIWAVYDTLDAMPRFYARIRKVLSPGFKLRITWLEPVPDGEDEIKWVDEDLPVSCGKFKHGNSENTEDRLMFSHLVYWEKGSTRDSFKIYPRNGETWALFKNWDIKWNSDPDSNRKYEFEFVEVLSEYSEDVGIYVAYLGKVKGFASLFCRTLKEGMDSFRIPLSELFMFSHRVPSFKMTGEEGNGVPKGSFELDPASLPTNLEEIAVPENLNVEAGNKHTNGLGSKSPEDVKPMTGSEGSASKCQGGEETHLEPEDKSSDNVITDHSAAPFSTPDNVITDHSAAPVSTPEAYEIPEPEFYNFDADKSQEKFQIGQIWALYSDEDGLPKYYGQIKKIESHPEFKLHVTWLVACSLPNDITPWLDKHMPICCGKFMLGKGKVQEYTATTSFSHQLRAEPTDKKNVYAIFPRKGEVWALYKNWNAAMKPSDLENCEYDMVEVLEENDLRKVLVLERVDGFNAVFKAQIKGGSAVTMEISRVELLRFSHQIPAFRLKEERGGSLRGFWELDPASLPVLLFCSN